MIFFKLWRHDLRYGLSKRLLLYLLVAFGQAFLFCKGFSNWIGNMSGLPEIGELSDTFGNYLIYLFQGMDEYVATPDKAFEFPAMWILIFLCGNALTLTYPLRDLEGVGQQLLIRSVPADDHGAGEHLAQMAAALHTPFHDLYAHAKVLQHGGEIV